MAVTVQLSDAAIGVLRFEIKGYRSKRPGRRLVAYRELAEAGLMEPVPGSDSEYRFTEDGLACRETVLAEAEDRLEFETFGVPNPSTLSESAKAVLLACDTGRNPEVDASNIVAYRELTAAKIMYPVSTFMSGGEAIFRFTKHGWNRRHEWLALPSESP